MALALFARGQEVAAARGLILADTKYEFGTDGQGRIVLADEIHTPDSSRYWSPTATPGASPGRRPESFDKDVVRPGWRPGATPIAIAIPPIPPEWCCTPRRSTSGLSRRSPASPSAAAAGAAAGAHPLGAGAVFRP